VRLSILGLVLGLAYLSVPAYQAYQVLSKRSFGGLFSQEFALFVVTLPGSILSEKPVKHGNFGRMLVYAVSALLNAAALYYVGVGLAWVWFRIRAG